MSESQTFYLLLALLYLSSCIKSRPPSTLGITKRLRKGWALTEPIVTLGGIRKAIFLTPLLPWPKALIISAPPQTPEEKMLTRASAIRLINLAYRATSQLRFTSFLIFLLLLVIIPLIYKYEGDTFRLRLVIAYAGMIILFTCLLVYCLHRRFHPKAKSERFKNIFFTLTMPWHAMRAADEILFANHLSRIPPLTLVSIGNHSSNEKFLAQTYRNAIYLKNSEYKKSEIEQNLKSSNIDPSKFLYPPTHNDQDSTLYCPCCHTAFNAPATNCEECENIPLKHFTNKNCKEATIT